MIIRRVLVGAATIAALCSCSPFQLLHPAPAPSHETVYTIPVGEVDGPRLCNDCPLPVLSQLGTARTGHG